MDLTFLPLVNAILNATAAVLLGIGWILIRRGRIRQHRRVMLTAFSVSVLFLISYLTYHAKFGAKHYTGHGPIRVLYFAILLTHTVLAAAIVPLALITLSRALAARYDRHR